MNQEPSCLKKYDNFMLNKLAVQSIELRKNRILFKGISNRKICNSLNESFYYYL